MHGEMTESNRSEISASREASGTVYLVSCVAQKQSAPLPAKDLYISPWFKKARNYVEASASAWFILSAEYGLVSPDAIIVPYEKTLNNMSVASRRAWARMVGAQLREQLGDVDRVVVLAGERYREFLLPTLRELAGTVEVPMAGLRIGEQLRWLHTHEQN